MIYLSFIWHMHQPYYRDLATNEFYLPWVRLHAIKDYLDMVKILENYPRIHQTFNLVPCLIEQIQAYLPAGQAGVDGAQDRYQAHSYKRALELNDQEKHFIKEHFFSSHLSNIIALYPRYLQLYHKKQREEEFSIQDYLDLQVWFNLAWFDPSSKKSIAELKNLIAKARDFTEYDKQVVLKQQLELMKEILPTYKRFQDSGQIEITTTPYYHPITPLLFNSNIAKEANRAAHLPDPGFAHPEDAQAQIKQAVDSYQNVFSRQARGMWPSEEAVSEHIIPYIIDAGIKWIITDEEILFRSLKKKRDPRLLYRPHLLKREGGDLAILFRDRNLSDLIGFVYHGLTEHAAVADFIGHLHNIAKIFKGADCLVVIALDGENAWEYYRNDGWDFLTHLYKCLSADKLIQAVTVNEYLQRFPAKGNIKRLSAGSWIYGNFNKWLGQEQKNKAWEYLAMARAELAKLPENLEKAWKQIYICEGSDWFWWYGDNNADFDYLFRKHLSNFYKFIGKEPPEYLNKPI
jgi:alpha-amylase/alpha-mannosidase (GH57 family)